jgi:pimeloyl-ACP methyl ester carboxylesterase
MRRIIVLLIALWSALACDSQHSSKPSPTLRLFTAGSGIPAVIFEAGLGDTSDTWGGVAARIAQDTLVVRYDRAGLGASPATTAARTSSRIAAELHASLRSRGIRPPYVLVAHSAGAWHALVYTARYSDDVAAVVLVDPTPPTFFRDVPSLQSPSERDEFARQTAQYASKASPGRLAEWAARDAAAREAAVAPFPRRTPLVVLSANATQEGRNAKIRAYWLTEHSKLAALSDFGRVVQVNAPHYIHLANPELVAFHIRGVLRPKNGA